MGQLFDSNGLTKSGLDYGNGKQQFYGTQDEAMNHANQELQSLPSPTLTVVPAQAATAVAPTVTKVRVGRIDPQTGQAPEVELGADQPPEIRSLGGGVQIEQPDTSKLPTFVKPTFQEAAADEYGIPKAMSPGLTKLGKFMQIIGAAARGGMAGQAASEQALAASGGRRNGGFGLGFQTAQQEPYQRAEILRENERGTMQNQVQKQHIAMLPFLARMQQQKALLDQQKTLSDINKNRFVTPRAGGVYDTSTGTWAPGTEPQDKTTTVENQLAAAVQKAVDAGQNPAEDPTVKQITDVITGKMRQPEERTSPDAIWYRAYKTEHNGEEPGTQALMQYLHSKTQNTHITVRTNQTGVGGDDKEMLVQGLLNGSIDVTGLGRMNGPLRSQVLAEAMRRDPNFTMANYPTRRAIYSYFYNGKGADQIQSFNTFLGHARDLSEVVNQYRMPGGNINPLINKPLNWIRNKMWGSTEYARLMASLQPVRDEFMTFLQNNHAMTDADRKAGDTILSDSATPAQLQAAIKQISHTAAIRLGENNNRYRRVFGQDIPDLLPEDNAQFLRQVGAYDQVYKDKVPGGKAFGGSSSSPSSGNRNRPPLGSFDH